MASLTDVCLKLKPFIYKNTSSCKYCTLLILYFIYFIPCINLFNTLNKIGLTKGVSPNDVFIAKLRNNPLASCSLMYFNFLLLHTAHFDKSIILPFFVFTTFAFLLCVFFLHFK